MMKKKEEDRDLFRNYLNGNSTPEEQRKLEEMIRNNPEITGWMAEEMEQADPELDGELLARMYDRIRSEIKVQPPQPLQRWHSALRWTAIMLLPLASALITYLVTASSAGFGEQAAVTVTAGYGEKAEVTLADGSRVWLNSGSELTYRQKSFNRKERRVFLKGEACFEVESDAKKPFVVETKEMVLEAMGTTFNVTAYEEDAIAQSVLLEGRLKVTAAGKERMLTENRRATFCKQGNTLTTDAVHAADYLEWRDGSFYFENRSFTEIAQTLSRVFNVEIQFRSEELGEMHFTGTLGNSGIRNVLDILTLASPMHYEMKGTTIELFLREKKEKNGLPYN